ncbi:MAG: hypothetical protein PUH30_00095 [Oscillospiraceae bacterium]|nr:hypothetical protein [Oscillospiraceae bacterium]
MTKKYRSKITMVGMEESPLLSLRFISGKFFFSRESIAAAATTAKMNAIHSPAVWGLLRLIVKSSCVIDLLSIPNR